MSIKQMIAFVALCIATMLMLPILLLFGPGFVQVVTFWVLYVILFLATVACYRKDPQVAVSGIIVLVLTILSIGGSPTLRRVMRFKPPNHSMQRMGASRFAHLEIGAQWRLAATADAERSAGAQA